MDEKYSTTDFYVAALLVGLKYEVLEIKVEGKVGKTKRFFFQDSPQLRQDILDFMNNKKEGKLRDFRDGIKTVKDLIHS